MPAVLKVVLAEAVVKKRAVACRDSLPVFNGRSKKTTRPSGSRGTNMYSNSDILQYDV